MDGSGGAQVRHPQSDLTNYRSSVLALLLVALSIGLDNLGATTALGVSGVDRRLRLQVALIFGVFEGHVARGPLTRALAGSAPG